MINTARAALRASSNPLSCRTLTRTITNFSYTNTTNSDTNNRCTNIKNQTQHLHTTSIVKESKDSKDTNTSTEATPTSTEATPTSTEATPTSTEATSTSTEATSISTSIKEPYRPTLSDKRKFVEPVVPSLLQRYGKDGFLVSNTLIKGPVAIFPKHALLWKGVKSVADLTPEKFALFAVSNPPIELLVIGTGDKGERLGN